MSMRYKGGVVSATADTPGNAGTGPASGVWTLTDQSQAVAASTWPTQAGFNYGFLNGDLCYREYGYATAVDQSGNGYYIGKYTTGGISTITKLDTTNTFSSVLYSATTTGVPVFIGSYNGVMYFTVTTGRNLYGFSTTSYASGVFYSWPLTVGAGGWHFNSGAIDGSGNVYALLTSYNCCGEATTFYLSRTTQAVSKSSKWYLQTKVYGGGVSVNSSGAIGISAGNRTSCVPQMSFTYLSSYDAASPSWSIYSSSWTTNVPVSYINEDGSVILACLTNVVKLSSSGSIVWQRNFTAGSSCYAGALTVDSSGNIYVYFGVVVDGATQSYVVKYNSSGTIQWQRRLRYTDGNPGFSTTGITVDYGGAYYLNISQSTNVDFNALLLKLPTSGRIGGTGTFATYFVYEAGVGTDSAGAISFTTPTTSWSNGSATTYGVTLNSRTSTTMINTGASVTPSAFS